VQKQEMDRRAENLAKNPGTGLSWDQAKAEIRSATMAEIILAERPENIPIKDWQKEELLRRKAEHAQSPEGALSWEEAKEQILRRRNG
jgi:putative addiction module component (TIGR02574 family)